MKPADTWRKLKEKLFPYRHPDDVFCPVFDDYVDLGICVEVDEVIEGNIPVQSVPELAELMRIKKYSIEDLKKLHTTEGHKRK